MISDTELRFITILKKNKNNKFEYKKFQYKIKCHLNKDIYINAKQTESKHTYTNATKHNNKQK